VLGNLQYIVVTESRPEGQRKKFGAGLFGDRESLFQSRLPESRMAV